MENVAVNGDMICIDIAIIDDDDYEANHDFSLSIHLSVSPTLATVGPNAIITIQDNGGKNNIQYTCYTHVHLRNIQGR